MRIRKVALTQFRLALREPLATAAGRISEREGILVRLYGSAGFLGAGEATPVAGFGEATPVADSGEAGAVAGFGEAGAVAGFGMESPDESLTALIALAPQLVGENIRDLDALLDGIDAAAPHAACARSSLDAALHDAVARAAGRSVASWLALRSGRRARRSVPVNALLAAREPAPLAAEAASAVRAGFTVLKLKVGHGAVDEDIARVAAVRAAVGCSPRLRLDANGGWKEDEALDALMRLSVLGVEMVEQPVDANDLPALARLRASSPVRVAADESAAGAARAERVIALRAADAICLKLGASGGLRAALRLAELARDAGIDVFVTSGLDGAVARAAALQLAASLPGKLPACGLATGALLRDDLAACEPPDRGRLALPRGAGLGLVPETAALSRLAGGPTFEFEAGGG